MEFPVFLRLKGKLAVVVGSGAVGKRKAHALQLAGAMVRVVSPDAPWADVSPTVEWIQSEYRPIFTNGASLICACAPPEVNVRIVADAKAGRIWVNSASDPEAGDVGMAAVSQKGLIQIAVSTSGASPMLARRIAGFLGEQLDDSWIQWVQLLGEFRPLIRDRIPSLERRADLFNELCDARWHMMIESEGLETTRAQMQELVQQAIDA